MRNIWNVTGDIFSSMDCTVREMNVVAEDCKGGKQE